MLRILYGGLLSIALMGSTSAQTGVSKIECAAPEVTTIAEINYGTKLVRTWAKFDTFTNGPSTSSANITRDKITWRVTKSVGSASSRTTYTVDRKKRTLSAVNDKGRRLDAPCTAS